MKVNITELLAIFDELLPATDEEQKVYWFKASRKDGICITLCFSVYEESAGVIVNFSSEIAAARLRFKQCAEIRVLDMERKCLELLHSNGKGRCFIALQGDSVLEYSE